MSEFIVGARGHDFGRRSVEELLSSIGDAGFRCTQLAYTKAVESVKSYADVTPELVAATNAAVQKSGVSIAVDGTYVELSYADEDKRRAEVAKALSQVPVAKALRAGCMGSETTNMAKQPTVSRREAQEALLRSLGEILPVCEEQGVLFAVECVYYHAKNTPEAVQWAKELAEVLGFRHICTLTVQEHDKMIGYVSQLCHAIAVSLMCANDNSSLCEYTGDSFRDLTRIARINEKMWAELFLWNKENLISEIDQFDAALQQMRNALVSDDRDKLEQMFRLSTQRRAAFDKKLPE